jgi:hypothetical protein
MRFRQANKAQRKSEMVAEKMGEEAVSEITDKAWEQP